MSCHVLIKIIKSDLVINRTSKWQELDLCMIYAVFNNNP